ncbi:MAG: FAD-dependent oxidoreductase, partial [Nitrospinota bacterium]|nr:FAD-dependent oxidoreductase [Nitrospinota bacterium]
MSKIERVVIIGGGIIGTTLACFLSRDSRKVTLVERDALARATTAKNTGVLALCSRPADHRATMAWYGRNVYENLKTELKDAFGIDPRGSMVILPPGSAASLEFLEETVRGIKALGAEAEILDGPEVKRRAPGLGVDVRAALFDPSGALVDAVEISRALAADAVSRGAEIREHEPVRSIVTRGGR